MERRHIQGQFFFIPVGEQNQLQLPAQSQEVGVLLNQTNAAFTTTSHVWLILEQKKNRNNLVEIASVE
jgi:hypothetical protein